MKIVTASNGKQTVKMSKTEWQSIGKKAGWMKKAQIAPKPQGQQAPQQAQQGATQAPQAQQAKPQGQATQQPQQQAPQQAGKFSDGIPPEALKLLQQYGIGEQQLFKYVGKNDMQSNPEKAIGAGIEAAKKGDIQALKAALEQNKKKAGFFEKMGL